MTVKRLSLRSRDYSSHSANALLLKYENLYFLSINISDVFRDYEVSSHLGFRRLKMFYLPCFKSSFGQESRGVFVFKISTPWT